MTDHENGISISEDVSKIQYGFQIEPDGKFVRYVGAEDDVGHIVSYYMPIERHHKIMASARPGTCYARYRHEAPSSESTEELKVLYAELKPLAQKLEQLEQERIAVNDKIKSVSSQISKAKKNICATTKGHSWYVEPYCAGYKLGHHTHCTVCGCAMDFEETKEFEAYVKREADARRERDRPLIRQLSREICEREWERLEEEVVDDDGNQSD
jgi:hypothetical protein